VPGHTGGKGVTQAPPDAPPRGDNAVEMAYPVDPVPPRGPDQPGKPDPPG
jgi:hypothetical protein